MPDVFLMSADRWLLVGHLAVTSVVGGLALLGASRAWAAAEQARGDAGKTHADRKKVERLAADAPPDVIPFPGRPDPVRDGVPVDGHGNEHGPLLRPAAWSDADRDEE